MGEPPDDTTGGPFTRIPVLPNPKGGDLVVPVKCYVDEAHTQDSTHDLVVHEDWTVSVPHDLESERVVAALGGYLSCLGLVDRAAPAAETYVRRQLRADLPRIVRGIGGRWYCKRRVATCCANSASWVSAMLAAAHWRSARHVAAELDCHTKQLEDLGKALLRARGLREPLSVKVQPELVGTVVTKTQDLHDLWDAGLSPDLVTALHRAVNATRPLPFAFYVGVALRRPSLAWIRTTAEEVPERADFTWLSWTESRADKKDRGLRARWLSLGVPRADIDTLTDSPYGPEEVRRLAQALGRSANAAAGLLARCVRAECTPDLKELAAACAAADPPPEVVSSATLHRLMSLIDLPATREQAALALLTCGSPVVAADLIRTTGTLDLAALRDALSDMEQQRQRKAAPHS
jgi:hypothetical protein